MSSNVSLSLSIFLCGGGMLSIGESSSSYNTQWENNTTTIYIHVMYLLYLMYHCGLVFLSYGVYLIIAL